MIDRSTKGSECWSSDPSGGWALATTESERRRVDNDRRWETEYLPRGTGGHYDVHLVRERR
eukprot:scaffold2244_cov363-Pavlova_lutheri.AAC.6